MRQELAVVLEILLPRGAELRNRVYDAFERRPLGFSSHCRSKS
jgi:hypothetical protein